MRDNKYKVYINNPPSQSEMEQNIRKEIISISRQTLRIVSTCLQVSGLLRSFRPALL